MSNQNLKTGDLVRIASDEELQPYIFGDWNPFLDGLFVLPEIIGVFLDQESFFLEGEEKPHQMCRVLLCNGTVEWFYLEAVQLYKEEKE
jgi:hypothetical protein